MTMSVPWSCSLTGGSWEHAIIVNVNDCPPLLRWPPGFIKEDTISQEHTTKSDLPSPSLAEDAGYLLARAGGRAISEFNRALQSYGMRRWQYTVLVVAADNGTRSQREIGLLLGIDPSAIVTIVDDLEREGLVRREPHPKDRRTRQIVATSAGRERLAKLRPVATTISEGLLHNLDEAERRTLLDLLLRIAHE
ncbi:MarR family transcriptional regulator [Nonomuraea sp. NPDC046570]|uniref:MarR family winged helix-turn-helix transcriptional regulator n=1 Tax=Nonomuraea sp. NPDC046570 TaxID=3155255 RepID=UPI003405200E